MKILQYYERLDLGLEATPHFKRPQYMSVYIAVFIFYKKQLCAQGFYWLLQPIYLPSDYHISLISVLKSLYALFLLPFSICHLYHFSQKCHYPLSCQ